MARTRHASPQFFRPEKQPKCRKPFIASAARKLVGMQPTSKKTNYCRDMAKRTSASSSDFAASCAQGYGAAIAKASDRQSPGFRDK